MILQVFKVFNAFAKRINTKFYHCYCADRTAVSWMISHAQCSMTNGHILLVLIL